MRLTDRFYPIKSLLFFILLSGTSIQQSYSQKIDSDSLNGYFRSPLNIPLYLSGDFCELRKNHFHTGLDIKCNGASGYKIYATADGYLGRIKVGHYGYGRVLYINHPNGLTTVYAHQSKFNDALENYVRQQQGENKNDQIDIYPDSTLFKFKKGDVIGYTGNSGTSSGAHLHFEIRETKTDDPLNPWLFGFDIKDEIAPSIYGIKVYPLNDTSTVNGSVNPQIIKTIGSGKEYKLNGTLTAYGEIGFAVHTIDMTTGSGNQCGPYSIELLNEKDTIFRTVFDKVTFATNRFINVHMDYLAYRDLENSYHKSFIKGNNQLPIYTHKKNNGWINADGKNKKAMKFVVKDINGNTSVLSFDLQTTKKTAPPGNGSCDLQIKWDKDTVLRKDDIIVSFPDSSLYDDLCLKYDRIESSAGYYAAIHKLHDDDIPIMNPIELKIKTNLTDTTLIDKLTGVFINEKGSISSEGGEYKDGYMIWTTKTFGKYSVMMDTKGPVITPALNYEGRLIPDGGSMSFTLGDNLSGISKYNAYINGLWVLAIYDPFKHKLNIEVDQNMLDPGSQEFILKVEDKIGNATIYTCKFKR